MITKTLEELLTIYTQQELFNDLIDEASQEQVIDHFYYRHCTDDERFKKYFTRNLNRIADQYNNILRIETINFDPLVTKYLEQQDEKKRRKTTGLTGEVTESYRDTTSLEDTTTVKTDNETTDSVTINTDTEHNESFSNSGHHNTDDTYTNTDDIRTRDLVSNTPHSNVSSATSMNLMANVNWAYASGMTDHGEDNSHGHTGNTEGTTTESGTSGGTTDVDTTQSGSTVLDGTQLTTRNAGNTINGSKSKTDTKEGTEQDNETLQKIYTGREGSPQDLLDKARTYLRKSNAIEWLFDELEICFMPDLLYGEDF